MKVSLSRLSVDEPGFAAATGGADSLETSARSQIPAEHMQALKGFEHQCRLVKNNGAVELFRTFAFGGALDLRPATVVLKTPLFLKALMLCQHLTAGHRTEP